ncbi:MAG: LemA family protein [Candidatus Diapherotrites archaeon]
MLEWIVLIVIAVIAVALIAIYNGLISSRNRVKNAWSQIDVELKRRFDLIPNLVETVKGYMKHERGTFEEVTKLRSQLMNASGRKEQGQISDMLSGALKSLFAVAENYPELKANENFKMLQEELSGTENKIAYSRKFYNDSVYMYNTSVQSFPTNVIAGMFGFKESEFFGIAESEKGPVKVQF